ncbi:ABC transporter permease [Cohnella herbarum]|uniref:Sugar ABC transporter permease n=1 Tax=Cohnella herbarum TaxID=2728023 RepID=A0A7Z2ZPL2_9BACL|nr:ABC transporter permease subunit [Cohnella herbarum]QJD87005.1 sugar ABC transporter permease [Cohnella herbarum]
MKKATYEPKIGWNWRRNWQLHAMMVPAVIAVFIFAYLPMAGVIMAFQDFKPWLGIGGSPWVGFNNFHKLFGQQDSVQVIWNTVVISAWKIVAGLVVPFLFALLLNEVRKAAFKRTVQTLVYLPHFLSWVILGGILIDMLSVDGGMINRLLYNLFGIDPIFFLGDGNWFRFTIVVSHVWKEFGFSTIVFLATLAGINPTLYEAALVDGANRWKQTLHITVPAMIPITIVVGTLALGGILNAGFDQIFNLYNSMVYEKGDIIDTYVYRTALVQGNLGFGTAVGLFKSIIGMFLIVTAYRMAYVWANYRIF